MSESFIPPGHPYSDATYWEGKSGESIKAFDPLALAWVGKTIAFRTAKLLLECAVQLIFQRSP